MECIGLPFIHFVHWCRNIDRTGERWHDGRTQRRWIESANWRRNPNTFLQQHDQMYVHQIPQIILHSNHKFCSHVGSLCQHSWCKSSLRVRRSYLLQWLAVGNTPIPSSLPNTVSCLLWVGTSLTEDQAYHIMGIRIRLDMSVSCPLLIHMEKQVCENRWFTITRVKWQQTRRTIL